MKKTNNSEDNQDDTDELRKKKLKTDIVTDQMVPVPENSPLRKEEEEREEITDKNDVKKDEFHSLANKQWDAALEKQGLPNLVYEDINSPENFDDYDDEGRETHECCDEETSDNTKEDYAPENYVAQEIVASIDAEEAPVSYDAEEVSENQEALSVEETYVTEDCSLPSSDVALIHREISPVTEAAPTVCSVASVEDDIDGDAEEEEVEGETEVVEYAFNTEEEGVNDTVESNENFVEMPEERGIVPEVEDVTCDSGGDTVLVMKHKISSEECGVSKPNVCTEEEMTYTDQLNSIESVDEMIFHTRSTVIDTGNTSASLNVHENSVMNCGDDHLVCELPQRDTAGVVSYCDEYREMGVSSMFPKGVCNSVCISSVPEPSESELYVYDPSVQNMMFCRSSTIIDARTLPVNSNMNGLETYSFHRVPIESSSGIKNVNDTYGHTHAGLCPVLQEPRFEFDNRDMKPVKKLPTEEDFMRRIEKTLFESKIETKIEDTVDSKYKSELDLSLPLKKRLRTLAAISNATCTPERFVSPKEESFPSYPAKPMISIAELEFTEGLIPKPRNTYLDNYK